MAVFQGNKVGLKVGTTDLSAYVTSVTLSQEFDQLEITAMGDLGHKYVAGLENSSISIEFNADFAASSVNQTINGATAGNGLVGSTASITILPDKAAAVGASNPLYTATCFVSQWPQVFSVSELAMVSVTWPVNGNITKAITGTF
jgi:hypothetical protein